MQTVAVIGAGFTGTMIAAHLLRRSPGPVRVALCDRSGRFGPGVAYGTGCPQHVLNVPAGRMSAYEEDPDHFVRWARRQDPSIAGGSFVPRMLYGAYLEWVLQDAEAVSPRARVDRISAAAVGIEATPSPVVVLDDGRRVGADRVVVAVGNFAPADPTVRDGAGVLRPPSYIRDPWSGDLAGIRATDDVVLLGTGLTMIDVVLDLHARGHRGVIHAVSRRGLLPQAHRSPAVPHHPERPADLDRWPRTARGLLRALRREVRRAAEHGIDWREVVTSLRADTPQLWASLSPAEQRRFLDRLRPFWDTHRHRAAPQPAATIERLIGEGRLKVHAGRLTAVRPGAGGVEVDVRPRGEDRILTLRAGALVNCTGPDTDLSRCADPLICNLRDGGLIQPDSLGLGLLATETGIAIGSRGPVHWLTIAGPLRRAQLWENTAVPELRIEAAAAARRLAMELATLPARPACSGEASAGHI